MSNPSAAGAARPEPDVLVVGAGAVGLFCAYHLRRSGRSVVLVERGPIGGPQSCSSGNTGLVGSQGAAPLAEPAVLAHGLRRLLDPESPLYVRPRWDRDLVRWLWHFRRACNERDAAAAAEVLLRMKKRSLEILRELCATAGLAATLSARGVLLAFKTEQAFELACRSVPRLVGAGVPVRPLGPEELKELQPGVEFDVCGALYNEEGARLQVPEFVHAFARLLDGMGVDTLPRTEVVGFDAVGGTIDRVRTTGGDLRPREVVIAAGVWSAECARTLGLRLPLQPVKGYAVTVEAAPNSPRLPVLLVEGRVAVAPLDDRLRFGGTLELSGMDRDVPRQRVDAILRTVRAYLPELARTEPVGTWCGLRPCTPDSLPFVGRAEGYRNLSVACGHGHMGMGLAPVTGKLVAQVVAGEQPDMDLTPLRVDRYSRRPRRLRPAPP
jgi:D-amino-acid dehydrogenase